MPNLAINNNRNLNGLLKRIKKSMSERCFQTKWTIYLKKRFHNRIALSVKTLTTMATTRSKSREINVINTVGSPPGKSKKGKKKGKKGQGRRVSSPTLNHLQVTSETEMHCMND